MPQNAAYSHPVNVCSLSKLKRDCKTELQLNIQTVEQWNTRPGI